MNFPMIEPLESRIAPASLSILQPVDSPKNEGNLGGTTPYVFKFVLDAPVAGDVTFLASTLNDSATAGSDFVGITDQLVTILAGQTEATLTVDVNHDTDIESDEVFSVLINPASVTGDATVNAASASATIKNDDREVRIVGSASSLEGDFGTSDMVFTVTLSSVATEDVTVTYSTADGTANGSDYTQAVGLTIIIPAGSTTAQIRVPISGDLNGEADETFTVQLMSAMNATIKAGEDISVGTILNDLKLSIAAPAAVSESGPNLGYTVTLQEGFIFPVTVDFATQNATATASLDYTQTNGTLNFNADGTQQINVAVLQDTLQEGTETLNVVLSNARQNGVAVNAFVPGQGQASGSILDDDVQLYINDVMVIEGDEGQQTMFFTVTLSAAVSGAVSVKYNTLDGTAISTGLARDFEEITVASASTLTFAAGQTSKTIAVTVYGDLNADSASETFSVVLYDAMGAAIGNGTGTGTILENPADPVQSVSIGDAALSEADGGITTMDFLVTLNGGAVGQDTVVNFTVANGTAKSGADFTLPALSVTILAGETTATISIPVINDGTDENDETLTVNLTAAAGIPFARAIGTGTITDDDTATVSIGDVIAVEGSDAVFIVTLSTATERAVTVKWLTATGTAGAGDFTQSLTEKTLVIPAGQMTGEIRVPITNDSIEEPDETFDVILQPAGTDATIGDGTGTATILANDPYAVSVSSQTIMEGNAGTTMMVFTVSLPGESYQTITVDYSTSDDTAADGSDYVGDSGTLTFLPGVTSKQVMITINGDVDSELDEKFFFTLSNVSNATLATTTVDGVIRNDDSGYKLVRLSDSLNGPISISEGLEAGPVQYAEYKVIRTGATDIAGSVNYATQLDDSSGSTQATAGADFVSASGVISFAAGESISADTIRIEIKKDGTYELNERLKVRISDATNGLIDENAAESVITILDNDSVPTVTIGDAQIIESNVAQTMVFKVRLSNPAAGTITVDYATSNGSATSGADYTAQSGGITFAPGEIEKEISITISGDTFAENHESFTVTLSGAELTLLNPIPLTIDDASAAGEILNDDRLLSINNVSISEGNSGTKNLVFTVTLSGSMLESEPGNPLNTVSVNYSTVNGTATSGGTAPDYVVTSGSLVFVEGGATLQTITVPIIGDTLNEAAETFITRLSGVQGATISTAEGTGTITNDDAAPLANITSTVSVQEGSNAVFTVTLTEIAGQNTSIKWITVDGTAGNGDFTRSLTEQTLTIAAGQTTGQISIPTTNDSDEEGAETFSVQLQPSSTATIASGTGTATIESNDLRTIGVAGQSVTEGNAGTKNLVFTVSLSAVSTQSIMVNYTTSNGTATEGSDYVAQSGILTFAPGETSKEISVVINGDVAGEIDENLFLTLSNPTNALLGVNGANVAEGKILNDDTTYKLVRLSDSLNGPISITEEGLADVAQFAEYTVVRDGAVSITGTVNYSTAADNTPSAVQATAGSDFTTTTGTISFAAGATTSTSTIRVPIGKDSTFELDENFKVKLVSASNGLISETEGESVVTIEDNDAMPTVTIEDIKVTEGATGTKNMVFKVLLSNPAAGNVTVNYITSNGVAIAGEDYTAKSGTVTFIAGQTEANITISIKGDTLAEGHETFFITLSNAILELPSTTFTTLTIDDAEATGTIVNDDLYLNINSVVLTEGDIGTTDMVFTVTLQGAIAEAEDGEEANVVTVSYTTVNGSGATGAQAGGNLPDYISSSGLLTFTEGGATTQAITVAIVGDGWKESTETFTTRLSGAQGAAITTADGTGTILDNGDTTIAVAVSEVRVVEGNSGTRNATFTFELSDSMVGQVITLHAKTRPGSATENISSSNSADYVAIDQDFSFTPTVGTPKSFSITVLINSDTRFEASESFFLDITDLSGNVASSTESGGVTTARGIIYNDDIHIISAKEFEFVDVDGDLVNVKISKGSLLSGNGVNTSRVTLTPTGSVGGSSLENIILSSTNFSGSEYSGANLTITATPQLLGGGETIGDGLVNVKNIQSGVRSGETFVRGIGLGAVKIDGDLGRIEGGNHLAPNGVKRLEVASFGQSTTFNASAILGPIGTLIVHGDMTGSLKMYGASFGRIGTLKIEGALMGGSATDSGQIQFTGSIGTATIGSIIGGSGLRSGSLFGADNFTTSIGKVTVINGVIGGSGFGSGNIDVSALGSVTLGSLTGGSGFDSGRVNADNSINALTVNGDITGGSNSNTGYIKSGISLGKVLVKGDIVGGDGANSGAINAALYFSSLTVEGDIIGGGGATSGAISSISYQGIFLNSSITKLSVGKLVNNTPVDGNLIGGAGTNSGTLRFQGNVSTLSMMGDIVYGLEDEAEAGAGGILVTGKLNKGTIEGSIIGGSTKVGGLLTDSGYIRAGNIGNLLVKGDVISGENLGNGLANSGVIRSDNTITSLVINGDLKGSETSNAIVSAVNFIKKLQVGRDVEFAEILAGYATDPTATTPRATALNADAQIGTVQINGSIKASSIIAGLMAGADGKFGTFDDDVITGEGVTDSAKVISKIAKVIIGSALTAPVIPVDASFGIAAENVVSVQLGGIAMALIKGPHNDSGTELGTGSKINVMEV